MTPETTVEIYLANDNSFEISFLHMFNGSTSGPRNIGLDR